ncbi:hypothetical protein [Falsirhodobacter sp. 1013]|uniref:hypothetical protein n=1 Tax=Falsirhodobacter sp. 1013 TaxID=3417566 RepID=UPI003EBF3503
MTPTNDNATAGRFDPLWSMEEMLECPEGQYVRASDYAALQARVAEMEAERDAARKYAAEVRIRENAAEDARITAVDALSAALSREKEAKAEGMRAAAEIADSACVGSFDWKGECGCSACEAADSIRAALAQSGGANPAQGKGDIATTALAYLVNAQHDLRTGADPARALATLSEGVAAVEAGMAGGGV